MTIAPDKIDQPRRGTPDTEPSGGGPRADRWRLFGFIALCLVCVAVAVGYVVSKGGEPKRKLDAAGAVEAGAPTAQALMVQPHIVLRETGAKFDLEQVDLREKKTKKGDDYWKINPKGYVPALGQDLSVVATQGPARFP